MKTASTALQTHLAGEVTTLCTCWKAVLKNGTVYGFTNHDQNIVFEGVTYKAAAGFTPSDIQSNSTLAVPGLDVEGLLSSDAITESDLMAGLWDFAEITVFLLNWADLTQGSMSLARGKLGEVNLRRSHFVAEMRGLSQAFSTQIGELYSPSCRASLGDTRCKVSMAAHTFTGSVTAVTGRDVFADSARTQADNYFAYGEITWTSGANNGLKMEVRTWVNASKTFSLFLPMPYDIQVGDTYSVTAGCDRLFNTCKTTFSNAVNFRGEPHVPGLGKVMKFGGQT